MKPILALLLLCLSLHAKDVTSAWFADGKFLEASESQWMTNDFGGRLDFTDDPNFLQNWRTHWNSISSVQHPGWVYVVLFVACKYDSQTQDTVYDLTVKQPDGFVCIHFTNLLAAKIQINPPASRHDTQPTLQLSPRFIILNIDPTDPVGTYTVEVELKDRLRHTSVKLKKNLLVHK